MACGPKIPEKFWLFLNSRPRRKNIHDQLCFLWLRILQRTDPRRSHPTAIHRSEIVLQRKPKKLWYIIGIREDFERSQNSRHYKKAHSKTDIIDRRRTNNEQSHRLLYWSRHLLPLWIFYLWTNELRIVSCSIRYKRWV